MPDIYRPFPGRCEVRIGMSIGDGDLPSKPLPPRARALPGPRPPSLRLHLRSASPYPPGGSKCPDDKGEVSSGTTVAIGADEKIVAPYR